jgi:hypothetical protein
MQSRLKHNAAATVTLTVLLVCILVYVASLGPAYWATQRGLISHKTYMSVYAPLHWIGRNCAPLKAVGDGYLGFWG